MPKIYGGVIYLGIDPGKSGGMVALQHGEVLEVIVMPDTDWDLWKWFDHIEFKCLAAIEKVRSSPQMGVTSAFTFGRGFGKLEMALTAKRIPLIDPDGTKPQDWQRALKIPKKKKNESQSQFKGRLRDAAQKLFPKLDLWKEPRSKGKQLAVCDALLLAEYCRRKDQGKL